MRGSGCEPPHRPALEGTRDAVRLWVRVYLDREDLLDGEVRQARWDWGTLPATV